VDRQANHRVGPGGLRPEDHLLGVQRPQRRVLEVDPDYVEGLRHQLRGGRAREREHRSHEAPALRHDGPQRLTHSAHR
jgi:hypothetical protein